MVLYCIFSTQFQFKIQAVLGFFRLGSRFNSWGGIWPIFPKTAQLRHEKCTGVWVCWIKIDFISHWRTQGGARPPSTLEGPNSFIFIQFSAKKLKNNSTFGSWRTPRENPGSATVSNYIFSLECRQHCVSWKTRLQLWETYTSELNSISSGSDKIHARKLAWEK